MASFTFQNLPGIDGLTEQSANTRARVGGRAGADALGTVTRRPDGMAIELVRELVPGGDPKFLRAAVSATSPEWKWRAGDEAGWPTLDLVLDASGGWNVSYACTQLFVDSWTLRRAVGGTGFEEVLRLRAKRVERRRAGQNTLVFDADAPPAR